MSWPLGETATDPSAHLQHQNQYFHKTAPHSQHIGFFLPALNEGGLEITTLNLAEALLCRGHRIDLVLLRGEGALLRVAPRGARIIELKPSPAWLAGAYALAMEPRLAMGLAPVWRRRGFSETLPCLPDLVRYLRHTAPSTLISTNLNLNILALWAKRLARAATQVVLIEHEIISWRRCADSKKRRHTLMLPLARRNYPQADAILAVSDGTAKTVSEMIGIPRDTITTIYNPVVTPSLLRKAEAPLSHPWFAPGSPPVVLSAGRLAKEKDFFTLVRAFAQVLKSRPAHLIILGNDFKPGDRSDLTALAADLGVSRHVELPGFVDNPFAYMKHAAVFVLSSTSESFGNVLVEAMACGCPVVSTDCPVGPTEILEGGAYGALVPVGDATALARAIVTTIDTPPDPERLRARAQTFSADRAADNYLDLLAQP